MTQDLKVELKTPILIDGIEQNYIILRRKMQMRDLIEAELACIARGVNIGEMLDSMLVNTTILNGLCQYPPRTLEQLTPDDYEKVIDCAQNQGFFG